MKTESLLSQTQKLLRRSGLRARKGLGQHFLIDEDVLKVEPETLLKELSAKHYKVVANLPYYITSPVLRHFLEAQIKPQSMVVMVQKEVAEEIAAKPGKMSLLSLGVQLYGEPEII